MARKLKCQFDADKKYESKRTMLVTARAPLPERARIVEIRDALGMTERDLVNQAVEMFYRSKMIV